MNVVRENVDDLNAILKITIAPEDYQKNVEGTLQKYRKSANMPGFRPGHTPMGLIKKQYGGQVLAEELNRLVNDSLYQFINDNKLDILGNPLPKEDAEVKGDFNNPSEFEFQYEIGLAPEFDIKLSGKNKYDYVKLKVDDELINKQMEDLRRRYGKLGSAEVVEEKDLVLGQFVELDAKGKIVEGGIMHSSTISLEFIEDTRTKNKILGAKVGDVITVDPKKVSKGEDDTAAMLGINEDQLEGLSKKFQMTINEIKRMELAELNQELFDKLYGEGTIKSEKEMKARIAEDLQGMFSNDSDKLLTRSVSNDLIAKTKFDLPDAFLKRWIKSSQKEDIPMETIEAEYDGYTKGLKWQLIQGKIFKENKLELNQAEVIDFTKGLLVNNYAQYGMPAPEDKELTETAQKVLENKEEANKVYEMLAETKLTSFFKDTVKLNEKEVSYDEYMKIAQEVAG